MVKGLGDMEQTQQEDFIEIAVKNIDDHGISQVSRDKIQMAIRAKYREKRTVIFRRTSDRYCDPQDRIFSIVLKRDSDEFVVTLVNNK